MTPEELKAEILSKTAEYYRLVHAPKRDAPFVPGESRVNYAGRVFDEKEMKQLVGIPAGKRLLLDVVVGYAAKPKRKKSRKDLEKVVSYNHY